MSGSSWFPHREWKCSFKCMVLIWLCGKEIHEKSLPSFISGYIDSSDGEEESFGIKTVNEREAISQWCRLTNINIKMKWTICKYAEYTASIDEK